MSKGQDAPTVVCMPHHHSSADHSTHSRPGTPDELLDLDGEVLQAYWDAALRWVLATVGDAPLSRVVDLGAGTGTGALGMARLLSTSEVLAVDVSKPSLQRLREKAAADGMDNHVRTVEADLDDGWPEVGSVDLTWASMSLHHLAEPGRVLAELRQSTTPGGALAVAEFAEPLRFLPDELGLERGGFEDRVLAVLGQAHTEQLPHLGSVWADVLTEAGWHTADERAFTIDLNPPTHPRAGRYAWSWFRRLSENLEDRLEPSDRATLAALLDEHGEQSLLHRTDLHIRGVRTVTLARAHRTGS